MTKLQQEMIRCAYNPFWYIGFWVNVISFAVEGVNNGANKETATKSKG